jgi:glucose 1-dehydrogenase
MQCTAIPATIAGMNPPLAGRTALVTGAGRGIGRAIAIALAEAGARVAVNDIDPRTASAVAEEIRAGDRHAIAVPCDVAELDAVEGIVARAVDEFGRLDIAVSNAAYSDREPFHVASLAGFRRTIDVTMWGPFNLLRTASRQMLAQPMLEGAKERGNVLIVGSPHAIQPIPNAMAYNMAKAAIDQMARTAAIELVGQRIRVNILHPGWTNTPGELKFASEEDLRRTGEMLPLGRLATPEEVARGAVFLCDPASQYITGSTLLIDGGLSLPWWATGGSAVPDCGRSK